MHHVACVALFQPRSDTRSRSLEEALGTEIAKMSRGVCLGEVLQVSEPIRMADSRKATLLQPSKTHTLAYDDRHILIVIETEFAV